MDLKITFSRFLIAIPLLLSWNITFSRNSKPVTALTEKNHNIFIDKAVAGFPQVKEVPAASFQLVTHGRPGELLLDGQWEDAKGIAAFIRKNRFLKTAIYQLNIYGCEFGKGEAGRHAVAYLQNTLGICVSASDDITGKDGDWDLEVGTYVSIKGLENYSGNLQYAGTDDFDGDGVVNSLDIDDDNDGAPDAVESPGCYYTSSEWNTGVKPANMVTITSALTTTTGNFSQLLDSVNNVTAVTFSNAPAQPIQNVNVYLFTFTYPVKLDALYLKFNTATQFAGTTKIQGSNTNNGIDWVDLSASISQTAGTNTTANGAVSVTTSIKYPVTLNTATSYKYIRITGVAASNIAAQNASEVYFDFNTSAYVASLYPKASCINDTDGDGILNQFDLDSDGDGCYDKHEANVTGRTLNGSLTDSLTIAHNTVGDAGANGLSNSVETAADNGIVNYTSTYSQYAISAAISSCIDSDGDSVFDVADLDDDNDGILDEEEQYCRSGSLEITGINGTIVDPNEFSYWETSPEVVIDFPN